MAVAVKALQAPRYRSVAEMSSYAGLSPKMIRRLVDSGKVRGFKVGRRLVIPFEEIDRATIRTDKHRRQPMSIANTAVSPHPSVDAHGRAIPLSAEEIRQRAEASIRALDALDDMGDEDEQRATLEALIEGIDAHPLSDRKRFG